MSKKYLVLLILSVTLLIFSAGCRTKTVVENGQGTDTPPQEQNTGETPDPAESGIPEAEERAINDSGVALLEFFSDSLKNRNYEEAAKLFTDEMIEEIALYDYEDPVVYLQEFFSSPGNISLDIREETPDTIYALIHRARGSTGFVAYRENGTWKLGFDLLNSGAYDNGYSDEDEQAYPALVLAILEPLANGELTGDVQYFVSGLNQYALQGELEGFSQAQSLVNTMYDYFMPVFYTDLTSDNVAAEMWNTLQEQIGELNASLQASLAYAEVNDSVSLQEEINRVNRHANEVQMSANELKSILKAHM